VTRERKGSKRSYKSVIKPHSSSEKRTMKDQKKEEKEPKKQKRKTERGMRNMTKPLPERETKLHLQSIVL